MFTKTKGGSGDTPNPQNPAQDAIKSASNKPAVRAAASIICSDVRIQGSIVSEGALQIDGDVEGDVTAADITIGGSGHIVGEVKAEMVKIKGKIKGSIRARKVELETGAHVEGDIVHASLAIQSNAVFEGQVKHADDPLKDAAPKAAAPRPSAPAPGATETPGMPMGGTPPRKLS